MLMTVTTTSLQYVKIVVVQALKFKDSSQMQKSPITAS